MKKFYTLIVLALLAATTVTAQDAIAHGRGRIENVTDYSLPIVSHPKARHIGTRATAPLPCVGSPKIPVVLVQFSDLPFTVEETDSAVQANYQKFFNGTGIEGQTYRVSGGSWGSVSDYYIEQSDSLFKPEFTVIGPVTLSSGYAYYGKDTGVHDVNINAFYSEACKLAMTTTDTSWSDFDNNGDGIIDLVFFIYAGYGQNDSEHNDANTIWPKESVNRLAVSVDEQTLTFGAYGCTCELYNNAQDGIGLVCHELSHGLGLPDLYDTSGNCYAMDYWDVMDSGCYQLDGKQPSGYSAYERDFMGWRSLETVEKDAQVTLTLAPIEQGGKGYVILNDGQPSGNEYFILENRQNLGFDTYLGCPTTGAFRTYGTCHGLLIIHVDYLQSSWTSNAVNSNSSHQRLTVVPADGTLISSLTDYSEKYFLSFRGDIYPGNQNVTEISSRAVFTDPTAPFTQTITNITEHADGTITVDINGGTPDAIHTPTLSGDATPIAIFSLSGQQQPTLQQGVNLVRMSNGQVKKVLIK
ncbi:MAG: M6 family metalloprotease domain-containing protein [Bacteroidaceae bacterium]|nr:M6 family metalloprotease domain-containing protein [Bacteroidaceae bacterium]